jgi:hypothetical protein
MFGEFEKLPSKSCDVFCNLAVQLLQCIARRMRTATSL